MAPEISLHLLHKCLQWIFTPRINVSHAQNLRKHFGIMGALVTED